MFVGAAQASAQESAAAHGTRDSAHVIAAEASVGVGSPLGWLGASLVVRPLRWVALHAGVGLGSVGVQWQAGIRGSVPAPPWLHVNDVDVGTSWSTGPYYWANYAEQTVQDDFGSPDGSKDYSRYWPQASWLNLEASFERALGAYASVRPFVGVGLILNGAHGVPLTSTTYQECYRCGEWTPFLGVALAVGP